MVEQAYGTGISVAGTKAPQPIEAATYQHVHEWNCKSAEQLHDLLARLEERIGAVLTNAPAEGCSGPKATVFACPLAEGAANLNERLDQANARLTSLIGRVGL